VVNFFTLQRTAGTSAQVVKPELPIHYRFVKEEMTENQHIR